MKRTLILGAGTAGTAMAHKLRRQLDDDWEVAVVDPSTTHVYQPGLLFLPFGDETEPRIVRERDATLGKGIVWYRTAVETIDTERRRVEVSDGDPLDYDILIIASGTEIRPDMIEGMVDGGWRKSVFDFYSLDGAKALQGALANFEGGRLVVNVVEMPIKCPVAPLEFTFLADAYLTKRGIRDKTELLFVTPLDGAFTKPLASKTLGYLLEDKGVQVETEFMTGEVDSEAGVIRSYDEREVPFDLLVTVPPHTGADFLEDSPLGDELGFVPTDPHTLAVKGLDHVFCIGDATDLPSSKAGSVAHFQVDLLSENIKRLLAGKELEPTFDGHSNCFVETGFGKAMLIDFNYETQPLPGQFPFPGIGPLPLLKEARRNHWAKLAFRWVYWNGLLPARPLPFSPTMQLAGKQLSAAAEVGGE
jgi:sulfide:quinone oxidoreductase